VGAGVTAAIVGGAALGLVVGPALFAAAAAAVLPGGAAAGAAAASSTAIFVGGIPATAITGAVAVAGIFGGTASYFLQTRPQRKAAERQATGLGGSDQQKRMARRQLAEMLGGAPAGLQRGPGMLGGLGGAQPGALRLAGGR
jgi:hypothetical protein